MKFTETKLKGAFVIELEPVEDERGFFARSFCQKEFKKYVGLFHVVQTNMSYNKKRGTLRGMHYQASPYGEIKLVQCVAGSIFDAIIDIRPKSSTFTQWTSVELSANNHRLLYVPKGFAHGYLTLEDNTTVFYQVSEFYNPKYERTIRRDDPDFGIDWPKMSKYIISEKDRNAGNFRTS